VQDDAAAANEVITDIANVYREPVDQLARIDPRLWQHRLTVAAHAVLGRLVANAKELQARFDTGVPSDLVQAFRAAQAAKTDGEFDHALKNARLQVERREGAARATAALRALVRRDLDALEALGDDAFSTEFIPTPDTSNFKPNATASA
jgi:hypothetical protein